MLVKVRMLKDYMGLRENVFVQLRKGDIIEVSEIGLDNDLAKGIYELVNEPKYYVYGNSGRLYEADDSKLAWAFKKGYDTAVNNKATDTPSVFKIMEEEIKCK